METSLNAESLGKLTSPLASPQSTCFRALTPLEQPVARSRFLALKLFHAGRCSLRLGYRNLSAKYRQYERREKLRTVGFCVARSLPMPALEAQIADRRIAVAAQDWQKTGV